MKSIFLLILVSVLGACGSRSDSAGDAENATFLELGAALGVSLNVRAVSNTNTIETGGSDQAVATISALITNESNVAVAGQKVEFSSTGGALQAAESETNANGVATAQLILAGDHRNQDLTVTVRSDEVSANVLVSAVGSALTLTGPSAVVLGDSVDLVLTLVAGNLQPLLNQEVVLSSASNNVITPSTVTTDSDGRATVNVSSANGDDTITATALDGTVLGTHEFVVASDILDFVAPEEGAEFAVGSVNEVRVEWTRQGEPVVGQDLRFGITAGQIISNSVITTDAAGRATIQVTSSSSGPATISVETVEGEQASTQYEVEFVALTPGNLQLNASSTRVSTLDTSILTARVTDINGNPVKNQEVNFSSADLKGGQLNPASATTNSEGLATVTFTGGYLASEYDEINIVAAIGGTSVSGSTKLTVVERVLNITIGTSGLLNIIAGEIQYGLPFAVQVADGGGTPLMDAVVEISIRPTEYQKGYYYIAVDQTGNPSEWAREITAVCQSEDSNGNRIMDAGEDVNGNGILDPQDPVLVAAHDSEVPTVVNGTILTDANGFGYFTIVYPASSSQWSSVDITARARALGAEAEELFHTSLPVSADRVNQLTATPPNAVSPFGTSASCADEL